MHGYALDALKGKERTVGKGMVGSITDEEKERRQHPLTRSPPAFSAVVEPVIEWKFIPQLQRPVKACICFLYVL